MITKKDRGGGGEGGLTLTLGQHFLVSIFGIIPLVCLFSAQVSWAPSKHIFKIDHVSAFLGFSGESLLGRGLLSFVCSLLKPRGTRHPTHTKAAQCHHAQIDLCTQCSSKFPQICPNAKEHLVGQLNFIADFGLNCLQK